MPNDLAVVEKAEQLQAALQSYDPKNYNLLLPTTDLRFIAPDHQIIINTVLLNPEDDFWPVDVSWSKVNGRWQKNVEGYALSKRGLRRLMHISGASVTDSQIRYDEEGRAHARASIQMTMADGLTRQFIANYTWDTPARIEEAEARYHEKIEREPANKAKHRKAFEADRHRIIKFATSLAESGAINRALRDALTTKNSYTPEEITKPFVCLQVVEPRQPEIDFNHPGIKQLMSMAMLNTGHLPEGLYHPTPTLQLADHTAGPDPMSDAVAADEVEVQERQPRDEFESQPAIIEEVEFPQPPHLGPGEDFALGPWTVTPDPRKWSDRPLDPEELRRRMHIQPGNDTPPSAEHFRRYHAAMSTLTSGDDDKRRRIENYFYGVDSSRDLKAWQVGRIYYWIGTRKEIIQEAGDDQEEISEWVPNPHAIKEMHAIVRAHQEDAGQLDMFDEPGQSREDFEEEI